MKTTNQSNVNGHQKSKKQKRATKTRSSANIAKRYLELCRLRERISEAEIEALRAVNGFRHKLARSAYLAALAASMVGWVWVLFQGVEWVLGA